MAQEIRRNGGDFHDFDKYAGEVIQTLGGISNLQLAPKGIIERIYPLPGNEKAIGHNLFNDDARSEDAFLAVETRTQTLAGLYELIQGGTALIGRNPVFLKKDGKEFFWGFASVMIRLEHLLAGTELNQLSSRGYEFQLSQTHPDTGKIEIFARSEGALGAYPVFKSINVPNGHWVISISRHQTLQFFTGFGIVVGFIAAMVFALLLNRVLREPERLRLQVEQKTEALEQMAFHDDLTGLVNRRFLSEQLNQEISNLKRNGGHIAVMYLDLDDFKRINDTMGHDIGDHLLQEVAKRLRRIVRENDIIARLGGDEFAVILLDLDTPDHARLIAEKIINNVSQPMYLGQREIVISTTIGITFAPDDSLDIVELFRNADLALFSSKRAGKSRFSFFNTQMQKSVANKLLWEEQLRKAIGKMEFYLVYQPIISLKNHQPEKLEALIRWRHPENGEQNPGDFISVAEETGLIIPIGYWVITNVCQFINDQLRQGRKTIPIAINISAQQLKDEDFGKRVEEIFQTAGTDPKLIELEITESLLMEDLDTALKLIGQMKRIGMRISIDDFGTGYSSLALLKKLPVNTLKIDRDFVKDLEVDINDRQIIEAITVMVHKLGIEVVAEGIETEGQLQFLRNIGCDYGQGFLFNKPLSANDTASLLVAAK